MTTLFKSNLFLSLDKVITVGNKDRWERRLGQLIAFISNKLFLLLLLNLLFILTCVKILINKRNVILMIIIDGVLFYFFMIVSRNYAVHPWSHTISAIRIKTFSIIVVTFRTNAFKLKSECLIFIFMWFFNRFSIALKYFRFVFLQFASIFLKRGFHLTWFTILEYLHAFQSHTLHFVFFRSRIFLNWLSLTRKLQIWSFRALHRLRCFLSKNWSKNYT